MTHAAAAATLKASGSLGELDSHGLAHQAPHDPFGLNAVNPAQMRRHRTEKWSVYPQDVIPAWVAEMDFTVAAPIRETLQRMVATSDLGYLNLEGPPVQELCELTAARMQRKYGWTIDPGLVELTGDVVQGLYVCLETFTRVGDGIVVQPPIYPPFTGAVNTTGRRVIANPLVRDGNGYSLDVNHLRSCIDERTQLLQLCSPHNPSGRVFTRRELEDIASVAVRHDLIIVADEIHADLAYPGHPHIPIASLDPEVAKRTITLTSASKAFSIPGLRCAVAIFGSPALKRTFCSMPRHLRHGASPLGVEATIAAWRDSNDWLQAVVTHLQQNRDLVADTVARRLPGVRHHTPQATYLAWLDCTSGNLQPDAAEFFLREARVALGQGKVFGPHCEGFVRINFATSRPILEALLDRMVAAWERARAR